MSLLSKWWKGWLRYVVLEVLDELSQQYTSGDPVTVSEAKAKVCKEIQRQRWVPGELRRWACRLVEDLQSDDLLKYLSRLRAVVKGW